MTARHDELIAHPQGVRELAILAASNPGDARRGADEKPAIAPEVTMPASAPVKVK